MRHHAVEPEPRRSLQRMKQGVEFRAGPRALPRHAGVDLNVNAERRRAGTNGLGEPMKLLGEPDYRGERMLAQRGDVGAIESGHDQDRRLLVCDAGFVHGAADQRALAGVRHPQPGSAGAGQDRHADGCTVSVGIGLNNGQKSGCRALIGHRAACDPLQRSHIVLQRALRDFNPRLASPHQDVSYRARLCRSFLADRRF